MENKNPYSSIFDYITSQEASFKTPIQLPGGWNWKMQEHLELSYLYSHGQLSTGKDEFKPVKNIILPILNLEHRAEDIELSDVQIYVDEPDNQHLSFLVKKYHDEVFVRENDLDTFFDELNVSRIDYGGGLSKLVSKGREVVPLHSIAFCDQTDILSGPIGIKHFFSPSQLQEMASAGWGDSKNGATATIEQAILLSREGKQEAQNNTTSNTPGRYIEIYEVHGDLPKRFLDPEDKSELFSRQMHIVAFYTKKDGKKNWVVLFQSEEKENPFKLTKRDPVYGRGLGYGGAEELFEAQVWTNYDMIRIQDMLDAAAKTIMLTNDKSLVNRHPSGLKDMDNMEFVYEEANGNTRQMDTFPRNAALFEKSAAGWEEYVNKLVPPSLLGKEPTAGTPFASLQAQIQQGMGLHEYRKKQFARHIEEIYQEDYIPMMMREITKGTRFLAELTLDELQYVAESMATSYVNEKIKKMILDGKMVTPEEQKMMTDVFKEEFTKKGNKHFLEVLKGEFKNKELKVKVTVSNKSKNLAEKTDKLVNIMRQIIAAPQMPQIPALANLFNQIIESSGLNPVDFSSMKLPPAPEHPTAPTPSPFQTNQPVA